MENSEPLIPDTYYNLAHFRNEDVYLPQMDQKAFIADFFPSSLTAIVQNLSNTVSAFYGLMLREAGKRFGNEVIDELSKATLYELGKRTVKQMEERKPGIERNAQGIAKIALAAIFNASPEYKFEVEQFEAMQVKILVKGIDRYHKIAVQLGMEGLISSPIGAFVQGINDGLGLQYRVRTDNRGLDTYSNCLYELTISL